MELGFCKGLFLSIVFVPFLCLSLGHIFKSVKPDSVTYLSVNHRSQQLMDTSLYLGGNGMKEVIINIKNVKLPLVCVEMTFFTCNLGESTLLNTMAMKNLLCVLDAIHCSPTKLVFHPCWTVELSGAWSAFLPWLLFIWRGSLYFENMLFPCLDERDDQCLTQFIASSWLACIVYKTGINLPYFFTFAQTKCTTLVMEDTKIPATSVLACFL